MIFWHDTSAHVIRSSGLSQSSWIGNYDSEIIRLENDYVGKHSSCEHLKTYEREEEDLSYHRYVYHWIYHCIYTIVIWHDQKQG